METSSRGDWRPSASLDVLRARAKLLALVRSFFAERGVLEVETPVLSQATITDSQLASLKTRFRGPGHPDGLDLYLQTSPEFAMKRLLAAGAGPIFQICKAFRDGESGSRHNPEFTILEWYTPGVDHHGLMDEMALLLEATLGTGQCQRISYGRLFEDRFGLDPHRCSSTALGRAAADAGLGPRPTLTDRDEWLALLMSHVLEPELGGDAPLFVFDYPASQAALARIRPGDPAVAERFEVYYRGCELANGFHELADADEQRRRFETELEARRSRGSLEPPVDECFLAALEEGLPDCSGVALGLDRLLMLHLGAESIDEVLAFPLDRA